MQFKSFQIYFFIFLNIFVKLSTSQQPSNNQNSKSPPDCKPSCYKSTSPDCNKFQIELRATIAPCTRLVSPFASTTPKNSFVTELPEDIEGLPTAQWNLKCSKKLLATLKITNQGETSTLNQYIIVDHVIDSETGQRVSLLNPYVVILRQKPLLQLYGLKYRNIVNAEAREQVINKRSLNFSGCDDVSDNPTCGNVRFNGDVIPYSQGFCCSCDEKKNFRRQPRNVRHKRNSTLDFQDFMYRNIVKKRNKRETHLKRDRKSAGYDFNDYRNRRIRPKFEKNNPVFFVPPQMMEDNNEGVTYAKDIFFAPNRNNLRLSAEDYSDNAEDGDASEEEEEYKHIVQIRGGQECDDDKWTSRREASPSYHDSAHCLRFSKLWYAIYQLSDPVLEHTIFVRIFEKREKEDGGTIWVDLTAGTTIGIGSLKSKYRDKFHTLIVTYVNGLQNGEPLPFSLDPKSKRLLIPQGVPKTEGRHQETEGGAPEYLVVDNKNIQTTGDQCDSAGVGYSAFYNQAKRCSVPRGTCLKNQPSQLWRMDKRTCSRRKRGKYFLKNFAKVPDNALRRTRKGDSKYLALNFGERFKSTIEMEIKADDNIVFRSMAVAKITEVYIDSSSETATVLTIKIHNNGLTSNTFHPRLADCPLELPVDWGNLEGSPVIIPPQHHSTFILRLLGILPVKNFYCSVEALNCKNEIVAVRRIRIIKNDRCICSWHCLCACLEKTGLGCALMSMEHYKAAGFIGSMPLTTNMVQVSYFEQAFFGLCFFSILLTITLLLMGLTKAVIGLCCFVPVGIWGLEMLIGIRPLKEYYEDELADRDIVYDEDGWPVHPDTHQRTVRIIGSKLEFSLNLIFFFTYPIMLMVVLCGKMCCPYYSYTGDEDKDIFFQGVNAVVYTKCPESRQEGSSESEQEEADEHAFDFESESRSSKTKSKRSRRSRKSKR